MPKTNTPTPDDLEERKTCSDCGKEFITKAEYDELSPRQQGYAVYMQGAHKGSPLRRTKNPYLKGSQRYEEWQQGNFAAMLDAQDGDD